MTPSASCQGEGESVCGAILRGESFVLRHPFEGRGLVGDRGNGWNRPTDLS